MVTQGDDIFATCRRRPQLVASVQDRATVLCAAWSKRGAASAPHPGPGPDRQANKLTGPPAVQQNQHVASVRRFLKQSSGLIRGFYRFLIDRNDHVAGFDP